VGLQGVGGKPYKLVLVALDNRDIHVVGGRAEILKLLAGKDINGSKMDLRVAVLAGLGGRHIDNLARTALDHDVTTLAQGRALHGVRGRGAGIGGTEVVLMLGRMVSAPEGGHSQFNEGRCEVVGSGCSFAAHVRILMYRGARAMRGGLSAQAHNKKQAITGAYLGVVRHLE
jgi:hypothetical protein